MPSGHKKRKSAKRKNMASASPLHQSWLQSHMQMLKASSFEKHDVPEKEAAGNGDREGEEHIFFEFKGGETASSSEMDASGNEDSRVSAIATAEIPSEAGNSQKLDVLKILALDKSDDELEEADKSELFELNGFSEESVTSDINVGWTGGLERNGREDNDTKGVEVGNSSEEVIASQVKEYVPEALVGEEAQATVKKEEVRVAHAMDASAWEKKNKAMKDAHWSIEATQDDEKDANTAKTEILHPPLVVHRASVWNCCGLLEVLMTSQH